jgi:mannose/cellobiose epimerase-like protein (N-acyl-D-glucosamine 2-epimerase family)
MNKNFTNLFIFISLCTITTSFGQYTPTSPYLNNPDKFVGYVDSCAKFWFNSYDATYGGFYSNVDRTGNVITSWGTNKRPLTQTRHAYGFSKAFMLTGNEVYLQKAQNALSFLYSKAWDYGNGGWFGDLNRDGSPVAASADKSAFDAHYAILGIASYYEATRDSVTLNWFKKGYDILENKYWDKSSSYGYYDVNTYNFSAKSGKSFNATVDALTTHLLLMSRITNDNRYRTKVDSVALNILYRIAPTMDQQQIGFAELYNSDWSIFQSETMTIMGHVLKTAWVLGRAYRLNPQPAYITTAKKLFNGVLLKGYDHIYGAPYKDFNRTTGQMLLWGIQDSAKAWWQVEQAITGGLELWDLTKDDEYLRTADESLNFFMNYFVDRTYGEVYENTMRRGGRVWGEHKGNGFKASYHSVELGYLTYLYSKIYIAKQPFSLYYKLSPNGLNRTISVNPLLTANGKLKITSVTLDGLPYQNFNANSLELTLSPNIGGKFKVTYQPQDLTDIAVEEEIPTNFALEQNFPNPFNPSTTINFNLTKESEVSLNVFDVMGNKVAELATGFFSAGKHSVKFDATTLNSGIYFYSLQTGTDKLTRKMTLIK